MSEACHAKNTGQIIRSSVGASHFLRRSGQTNRLTPHPGPLPLRGGEGESPAVSPRSWRRKSSNGQVLAITEPTAPPDSLSPSEGERVGVRGQPHDKRTAATSAELSRFPSEGKGWSEGLERTRLYRFWDAPLISVRPAWPYGARGVATR